MRREFTKATRRAADERAKGLCEECGVATAWARYDHTVPDWLGGPNTLDNCTRLCIGCHDEKTRRIDVPRIAKTKRLEAQRLHGLPKSKRPIPGGKDDKWKRTMGGKTVLRSAK
jgi:5-methylcytosine-specific restriction endonuclease McrA